MASKLCEELVEWFYKIPTNEVVSHDVIAKAIRDYRIALDLPDKGKAITQEVVNRTVSLVRRELELSKRTTLINVKNHGYKLATPKELALTTAKWVKRTIMYADRTYRLVDIVDRKLIPGAIKQVFTDSEGRIKSLSRHGKRFVESFVVYLDRQKQLQHSKGDSK